MIPIVSSLASGMSAATNFNPDFCSSFWSPSRKVRLARQAIELRDYQGRVVQAAERQGVGELRPVYALAALDLHELGNH